MTSTEMLGSLRTKLDEETASMWTDTECYQALNEGQHQVIGLLPPSLLSGNIAVRSLSGGSFASGKLHLAKPSSVFKLVSAELNGKPVRITPNDAKRNRLNDNSFMSASTTDPTMYEVVGGNVVYYVFEVATASSDTVEINYLPLPSNIDSSNDCKLIATTHPAIVQYAYAELLKKSDRLQESIGEFGLFIQMLGMIK